MFDLNDKLSGSREERRCNGQLVRTAASSTTCFFIWNKSQDRRRHLQKKGADGEWSCSIWTLRSFSSATLRCWCHYTWICIVMRLLGLRHQKPECKPADLFLFPLGLHHFLLLLQPYFLQTHAATCEDSMKGCCQREQLTPWTCGVGHGALTNTAGVDGHIGHCSAETKLLQSSKLCLRLYPAKSHSELNDKLRVTTTQTWTLTFLDFPSLLWVWWNDGEGFVTEMENIEYLQHFFGLAHHFTFESYELQSVLKNTNKWNLLVV